MAELAQAPHQIQTVVVEANASKSQTKRQTKTKNKRHTKNKSKMKKTKEYRVKHFLASVQSTDLKFKQGIECQQELKKILLRTDFLCSSAPETKI